ncbi:MAG: hypothetical protein AAF909_04245 [Pseudomonadota bacterium]
MRFSLNKRCAVSFGLSALVVGALSVIASVSTAAAQSSITICNRGTVNVYAAFYQSGGLLSGYRTWGFEEVRGGRCERVNTPDDRTIAVSFLRLDRQGRTGWTVYKFDEIGGGAPDPAASICVPVSGDPFRRTYGSKASATRRCEAGFGLAPTSISVYARRGHLTLNIRPSSRDEVTQVVGFRASGGLGGGSAGNQAGGLAEVERLRRDLELRRFCGGSIVTTFIGRSKETPEARAKREAREADKKRRCGFSPYHQKIDDRWARQKAVLAYDAETKRIKERLEALEKRLGVDK